ncbi:MAG: transglycosylase SLT domain-containing protein [Polyangiales bacterium]|jgi:hypothetical protein
MRDERGEAKLTTRDASRGRWRSDVTVWIVGALEVGVRINLSLVLVAILACGGSTSGTSTVAQASSNTSAENRAIARELIRNEYARWDNATQFQCLDDLWQAESHWNHRARNKRTGACGIPQAYPCNKMSELGKAYGVDYRANPWPQIAWGLRYIHKRYGTPCKAWRKFKRGGGY